ncbi:MAG: helix-turn-helix domain-containing protein [Hyphomicrobiaceae bacterium]|nr:helix-turn-helix domain-containing protein [Hyphomicrobiaceae bacterium]
MMPMKFIREHIFKISTQSEFADLLGYRQATISRFENGMAISSGAQGRIREKAKEMNIPWDNNWFFVIPDMAA